MLTDVQPVCGAKSSGSERVNCDEQGECGQVHRRKDDIGKDYGRDSHHNGEPRRPLKVSPCFEKCDIES